MDTTLLLHFIVVCLIIEATPGPNMGYLALLTVRHGRRAGVITVAGIAAGLAVIGSAAALGMAAALAEMPALYQALRWVCMAYLLWIAWQSWQDNDIVSPGTMAEVAHQAPYFRRGFVINVLNPKAAMFYVSTLPAFIDPASPALFQTLALTAFSVAVATAAHLTIVWLASRVTPALENTRRQRIFRKTMALLLAGVAVWFVL